MGEIIILNNYLKWDNTHLGIYEENVIIGVLNHNDIIYHSIRINNGIIYCIAVKTKNLFPCIVEDIKDIFGIKRRGIHQIKLGLNDYILYYVPVSTYSEIINETPLSHLDRNHELRIDKEFSNNVRKLLAFNDILSLSDTSEKNIIIRKDENNIFIPIGTNIITTSIIKGKDHSVLPNAIFTKWFGEKFMISNIIYEMISNKNHKTLSMLIGDIRTEINKIIYKYDSDYIWYSCFIIERLSNHLLYGELINV